VSGAQAMAFWESPATGRDRSDAATAAMGAAAQALVAHEAALQRGCAVNGCVMFPLLASHGQRTRCSSCTPTIPAQLLWSQVSCCVPALQPCIQCADACSPGCSNHLSSGLRMCSPIRADMQRLSLQPQPTPAAFGSMHAARRRLMLILTP
jgi:hypothetical protein